MLFSNVGLCVVYKMKYMRETMCKRNRQLMVKRHTKWSTAMWLVGNDVIPRGVHWSSGLRFWECGCADMRKSLPQCHSTSSWFYTHHWEYNTSKNLHINLITIRNACLTNACNNSRHFLLQDGKIQLASVIDPETKQLFSFCDLWSVHPSHQTWYQGVYQPYFSA